METGQAVETMSRPVTAADALGRRARSRASDAAGAAALRHAGVCRSETDERYNSLGGQRSSANARGRAEADPGTRFTGRVLPFGRYLRAAVQLRPVLRGWKRALREAGVARVPHDFRRTAIRNLERDGVPRSVAMAMVGQKTEEVYRRYAIVDDAMDQQVA